MAHYERSKLVKEIFLLDIELQSQERLCRTFSELATFAQNEEQLEQFDKYIDQSSEYAYEAEKLRMTLLKKVNQLIDKI